MTLTSVTRLTLSKPTFKGKDMKDIFENVIVCSILCGHTLSLLA